MKKYLLSCYDYMNTSNEKLKNTEIITKKTCDAINSVMKDIHTFKNEKDIEKYISKIMNYQETAFELICASGRNNSIIHYNDNNCDLKGLVLIDIGFKFNGYCSDVARTFPFNKKFNDKEKEIYNIVHNLSEYAINNINKCTNLKNLEQLVREKYLEYLFNIGFINKKDIALTYLFMPHRLGHSIGKQVHDYEFERFEEGVIFTIEPGLYFQDTLLENEFVNGEKVLEYWDIGGIRIEDMVTIKNGEILVLSNNLPKTIDNIEKIIKN